MRQRLPLLLALALAGCEGCESTPEGAPDGAACATDADCASGRCRDGACAPAACARPCGSVCCGEGEVCEGGACLPSDVAECLRAGGARCGAECCAPGEDCAGGTCLPACPTARCGPSRACCAEGETCHLGRSCCPSARACPAGCCAEGERCEGDVCRRACPDGRLGCGIEESCCAADETCLRGSCVAPGPACAPAPACATRPDQQGCPEGQVCDPELERCVPEIVDPTCTFTPPPGVFEPRPLFTWGRRRDRSCQSAMDCQTAERCENGQCQQTWPHVEPTEMPEHYQATSIPMVADLDGDCVPEIVFNTFRRSDFTRNGVLRAIRGDTGAPVWTVEDAAFRTDSTANPAVADVDGDGAPEVFVASTGKTIYRIAADGTPVWESDAYRGPEGSGSVTVANLDGEGDAELVFGAAVFDSDGRLLFEGAAGAGFAGQGPISCVADLDGDARAEIVAGRTVYETSGTVAGGDFAGQARVSASTPDGYCGIADLDGDGGPEVVLVASGRIHVLQRQTLAPLASVAIPGGGQGGAPNIADFDGDGRPDIGTAGARNYVVARYAPAGPSLEILWRAPTEDDSSSRTGSSVFDFDGDGRAEVVYNDEEYLRIYPGTEPSCPSGPECDGVMTDAEVLFRDLNSSRTRTEYPVVADVDGDFKAEIVFSTSNEARFLDPRLVGDAGIEVWDDRLDNWVATRPVWHQHAYAITQVGPGGQIPRRPPPSWRPDYNAWRRNAQGGRDARCAPDLVVTDLRQDRSACPALAVEVTVANRGCLAVGSGAELALRDGAGPIDTLTASTAVGAGASVRLRSTTFPGRGFSAVLTAEVDPAGRFNECREDNNRGPELPVSCGGGL